MKYRAILLAMILLAVLILVDFSGISAQESVQVPRRLLLLFEPMRGSNFSRNEQLLMYESLLVTLETEASEVAVFESANPNNIPDTAEERSRQAVKIGADAWLWVGIKGDRNDRITRNR